MTPKQKEKLQKLCRKYIKAICNWDGAEKADTHDEIADLLMRIKFPSEPSKYSRKRSYYGSKFREESRVITDNIRFIHGVNYGFVGVLPSEMKKYSDDLAERLYNLSTTKIQ